jgi:hypothetical protein
VDNQPNIDDFKTATSQKRYEIMDRSFTKDFKAKEDKLQGVIDQAAMGIVQDFKEGLILIKQLLLSGKYTIDRGLLSDISNGFTEIEKNCQGVKGRINILA